MITHEHPGYKKLRRKIGRGKFNGCFYYSKEIVKNIVPHIKTWRDWNTVGKDLDGMRDEMIVFLHDNSTPWNYSWLNNYHDLILICSSKYTMESVKYFGQTILLPMSVDTEYVSKFKSPKTKDTCFVGNTWVKDNTRQIIPDEVDFFSALPREKLLRELSKYRKAYAIDRCAIEAKILGCELLDLDTRYSVDNVGDVLDNHEAAKILQCELDKIDGGKNAYKTSYET